VGVHRELPDQLITTHMGVPPWSAKAFDLTVSELEHQSVVNSMISGDKFPDKHPSQWMKRAMITLDEAMEV